MNSSFLLLAANLTSVACVVGAAYLASKGAEGWGGYFLFVAVLCTQYISSGDE